VLGRGVVPEVGQAGLASPGGVAGAGWGVRLGAPNREPTSAKNSASVTEVLIIRSASSSKAAT
jgi:hypothetical protein